MSIDVDSLPRDPDLLIRLVLELEAKNADLAERIAAFERLVFGARSERVVAADPGQNELDLGDSSGSVRIFVCEGGHNGSEGAPEMPRRKEPKIPDGILDQLLAGADAKTAFDPNGLLDELKKALAERALNAEMDHHLGGEGGAGNGRNGYGKQDGDHRHRARSNWRCRGTGRQASTRSSSPSISGGFPASTTRSSRCTPAA